MPNLFLSDLISYKNSTNHSNQPRSAKAAASRAECRTRIIMISVPDAL